MAGELLSWRAEHLSALMLDMPKLCESGDGKPATRMGGTRCQACYRYYKNHGTFERTGPRPPISMEVVLHNVEHTESGCLVWRGTTDRDGRPLYFDGAVTRQA